MAETGRRRDGRRHPGRGQLKTIKITGGQPLAAPPKMRSSHWMLGLAGLEPTPIGGAETIADPVRCFGSRTSPGKG